MNKSLIGINYLWEQESHLLYGIVENQKLIIIEYRSYPEKTSYSVIVNDVKSIKYARFFTNLFTPFKYELRATMFEECEFLDENLKNLESTINSLIIENRLTIFKDIIEPEDNENYDRCQRILIKGAIPYICKKKSTISFGSSVTF